MIELKPLICAQCGAQINRKTMTCEYCGTQYEQEREMVYRIETYGARPVVIGTQAVIDKAIASSWDPGGISRMLCRRIAASLTDEIVKYMDVSVQEDVLTNNMVARGRVRVLPPDFKF